MNQSLGLGLQSLGLGLGLETLSLGLVLGLETQSLGLGLLDPSLHYITGILSLE